MIQGQTNNVINKLIDIDRYNITIMYFIRTLLSKYIILDVLILILIVMFIKNKKLFLSASLKILITMIIGYIAIYILTPNDLNWQLTTSCDRLLHQLYPSFLYIFLIAIFGTIEKSNGKGIYHFFQNRNSIIK